jgi:hypothetical protein
MQPNDNPFAGQGPVEGFLRLTGDGKWLYKGEPITHPGLVSILESNYRYEDGRYLVLLKLPQGTQKVAVEIEDVPYFVSHVTVEAARVTLALNDGTAELLDARGLRVAAGGATYVRVKAGRAQARLRRQAELGLANLLTERDGRLGLLLGGVFHPITQG